MKTQSRLRRFTSLAFAGAALSLSLAVPQAILQAQGARSGGPANGHWVATWATAVVARPQTPPPPQAFPSACQPFAPPPAPGTVVSPPATPPPPPVQFKNQTLRQIVHVTIGGERVRVVLSNAFGTAPLMVGSAHVALREKDAAIKPGSDRPLTFGGSPSTTIVAGAVAVSDPVMLAVPSFADLAIDMYLPGDTAASPSPLTTHGAAFQTSYVSTEGNHAGAADMPLMMPIQAWFFLSRVEVTAPRQVGTVVTLGDSITDGTRSTPNTNNRWPDQLAKRLAAENIRMAVINQGIAGNRLLCDGAGVSALARFDRDVLVQPGVTHVVVLESLNDVGFGRTNPIPTVADIIAGHRQLIERAHTRGLKIYGALLTPMEGAAYWTAEGEAKRQAINEWLRTSKAYDGLIDFATAVRDPASPTKILGRFDSGDKLHMNDAGYKAMADAIDLSLFRPGTPARKSTK